MTDSALAAAVHASDADAADIAAGWVADLAAAVTTGSASDLEPLFQEQATWRDFMAMSWDFSHAIGRAALVPWLLNLVKESEAGDFQVNQTVPPELVDGAIRVFFDFTTSNRTDRGHVVLSRDRGPFAASMVQTQLISLPEFPEGVRHNRPEGKVYDVVPNRTRWHEDRLQEQAFEDDEPAVVVLGAGHNGLSIAARLGALDVRTLVIEKEARVGDTWRKRYASLALHSTVWGDHLPYLPLPPNWTSHTPKDKWAGFLESYATLMDLNVWTSTTFLDAHYDDDAAVWSIRVERPDGTVRVLHPRHFVVAGGMYGPPRIPEIEGLDAYEGLAVHSDSFQNAADFAGKRALVIGAGVSGHELAHDLWEQGADVTMLQRSSTYVVSFASYHKIWNSLFTEDATLPAEYLDQIAYTLPAEGPGDDLQRTLVQLAKQEDQDLLDRLEARGFKLHWGPNGTGIIGARMAGADSFQIDIGASSLIADGTITLKQGVEVSEIVDGNTIVFSDGTRERYDLLVFATGYHNFWGHIGPALGDAGAKISDAYVRAADGELANTWRRSAQPGLWFATGFIRVVRYYSAFTAMLIKAIEEGIAPVDPTRPDHVASPSAKAG